MCVLLKANYLQMASVPEIGQRETNVIIELIYFENAV